MFAAWPGARADALPGHVRQVLDWHGVGPDRVHLLDRLTLARELWVAPQAEPYRTEGPSEAFLDLHAAKAGLRPAPCDVLYVTWAGLTARLRGGHVGEGYLAHVLAEAGVRVVDPGALTLRDQLAAYAGARHLVFAEGSAVHGRQLLGRMDQDITLLLRRDRSEFARANLAPRCRALSYITPNRARATPVRPGKPTDSFELVFYDVPALVGDFARMGVDLAARWDHDAYRAACEADLAAWRSAVRAGPKSFEVVASLAALDATLARRPLDPA